MPRSHRFHTGELIPHSGIYRVFHASHRLPHEVTLLRGETFPRCLKCDSAVAFQLIRQAPEIGTDGAFRVVLFGLPSTDDIIEESVATEDAEQATGTAGPLGPIATMRSAAVARDVQPERSLQSAFGQIDPLSAADGAQPAREKQKNWRKFKPGDPVPEHGLYTAEHKSHGLFHQATLRKDTRFPSCKTCGSEVRFSLLRSGKEKPVMPPSSSTILEDVEAPDIPSTEEG